MPSESGSNSLQTTATSMEVLELIEEMDGARVSELAERMDRPKSTVHGHLTTLKSKEFVVKNADDYHLGPELLRLGNAVRSREEGFILAREFTERMFERTGLRSNFSVEMGGKAVVVHTATGDRDGWTHERMGARLYLHNTAVGKAILSELPHRRIEQILDRWGLPAETDQTITSEAALFAELETIREQGYAVNREENKADLYAIGVAATDQSGEVIGGFSITGPEHSVLGQEREREMVQAVIELIDEYELELSLSK